MSTSTSTTARFHAAVNTFDRRVDGVFDRMRGNRVTDRLFYGASMNTNAHPALEA